MARRHFWEEPGFTVADGDSDSSSDEEDEMNPNAQRAGRELCDLLIWLRLAGRITSKTCCVIAWWANRAGAVGPCEALGKHPWAKSHHYQRHLDRQVNFAAQTRKQTILRVPGHAPHFNRGAGGSAAVNRQFHAQGRACGSGKNAPTYVVHE